MKEKPISSEKNSVISGVKSTEKSTSTVIDCTSSTPSKQKLMPVVEVKECGKRRQLVKKKLVTPEQVTPAVTRGQLKQKKATTANKDDKEEVVIVDEDKNA